MGDIAIFKTAQNMGDRINFANIAEKLVAEPFALGSTAHQSGNIDETQARRHTLGGACNICQRVKARFGHGNIANIRLNGAKRKIGGLRGGGFCQRIEQGGFTDIRQTHNTASESH